MIRKDLACFVHVRWRPDTRELKRFTVAMIAGFGVIGAIAAWKANGVTPVAGLFWFIGICLGALAQVRPISGAVYLSVNVPAAVAGYLMSHVILAFMFYLVFAPLGLFLRLVGKDLLQTARRPRTTWSGVEQGRKAKDYYRHF